MRFAIGDVVRDSTDMALGMVVGIAAHADRSVVLVLHQAICAPWSRMPTTSWPANGTNVERRACRHAGLYGLAVCTALIAFASARELGADR